MRYGDPVSRNRLLSRKRENRKKPSKLQNVSRCNYCRVKCGLSWRGTISTKLNYVIRSLSAPPWASAPTLPCGKVEGGCFVAHPPRPLNRFDFPTISNQASVPFKGVACLYGAVQERIRR